MLTQSPTVDPIEGLRCPYCRKNPVDEPQAPCTECQASEKNSMTTDAQLQARVDELEALIRQARRNNNTRNPNHAVLSVSARNPMQIHAHGPRFPAIDIEIEGATDSSSGHDDDNDDDDDDDDDLDDLLSVHDSDYADDEDNGCYEGKYIPMDVAQVATERLPEFQVPEARPFRPSIEALPVPEELLSHLMGVFCSYAFVFNFYKPIDVFLQQISLPHTHPDSPHPCLLSSIYLIACQLSPRHNTCIAPYIEIFNQSTLKLINEQPADPATADRPLDFCMALVLYARFCFYAQRFDAAVYFTNSAMSYAVGCGLHQIDLRSSSPVSSPVAGSAPTIPSAVTRTQVTGSFASGLEDNGLGSNNNTTGTDHFNSIDNDNRNNQATGLRFFPPPRDEHETIQRIRLWHSISIVERGSSWTSGIPPYLSDEDVTTPWPINSLGPTTPNGNENIRLQDIVSLSQPTPMLPSLFGSGPRSQARVLPGDTAISIRAKAAAFLERATYLARRTGAGDFMLTGGQGCQDTFTHAFGDHGYPCAADLTAASGECAATLGAPTHITHVGAAGKSQLCDLFYVRFAEFDEALRTFQSSIPPLTPEDLSTTPLSPAIAKSYIARVQHDIDTTGEDSMEVGWCPAQSPRTHTLITGHAMSLAASVRLHSILCETSPDSHQRMLDSALRIAELSRVTIEVDPRCFQLSAVVPLTVSGQVLIDELLLSRKPSCGTAGVEISHNHRPEVIEQMIQGLKTLLYSLRRLRTFYFIVERYESKLYQGVEKLGLEL